MNNEDKPKDIIDTLEEMLEERKSKGDRRQASQPVDEDRRSGTDRRHENGEDEQQ